MSEPQAIVQRLQLLVGEFRNQSGDVVIGRMIPELAGLLLAISVELDTAQRQMVRLTWAMFFLAFVTLVVGGFQLYISWPQTKQPEPQRLATPMPTKAAASPALASSSAK